MPVDIVLTDSAPYVVNAQQESRHTTLHKAIQAAIDEATKCGCEVKITRNTEYRVNKRPATAKITWQEPTQNEDGSEIGEVLGYEVLYSGQTYTTQQTEHIQKLQTGQHVFNIRTLTDYGNSVYKTVTVFIR